MTEPPLLSIVTGSRNRPELLVDMACLALIEPDEPDPFIMHFKVEDSMREGNALHFDEDNDRMRRAWENRSQQTRNKYRKTPFRYFEGLETRSPLDPCDRIA